MNYGAVHSSIGYDDSYYNEKTYGYYSEWLDTDHDIDIVGWDDNYSKDNFIDTPQGDGAFICRNSWGTDWGENGYFYVSYYDGNLVDNTVYTGIEDVNNYSNIYQYDPLGVVSHWGYGDSTAWFANVFTANSTTKTEELKAVSFYTRTENASYEIYADSNFETDGINKVNSFKVKTGTIAMPGYHTIKLDTPIKLTSGKKFVVAVKLTEAGEEYPIAVEVVDYDYSDDATSSYGQSYISHSGVTWKDFYNSNADGNVCLKAFTSYAEDSVVNSTSQIPDCVIIGSKAYSLKCLMNSSFAAEIKSQLSNTTQDKIYYKIKGLNNGQISKLSNGQTLTALELSKLSEITFKDVDGKEVKYH